MTPGTEKGSSVPGRGENGFPGTKVPRSMPAPDSLSLTGMSFYSQDKIDAIIRDCFVFHITYDENKNLQGVKIFWVTTIIAALLGLLCNHSFKWWHFNMQKRRLEKRRREREGQTGAA